MIRPLVAVAGGTGFLGSHAIEALSTAGWRVRMLVRGDASRWPAAGPEVEQVPGDLEDAEALARLVRGASAILNVAGLVKARNAAEFLSVNRDGAARLAAIATRETSGARLVHVSSLAARVPGLSPYAASKHAGETALRKVGGGLRITVLRPGVVYGPRDVEGTALLRLASRRLAPVPSAPEPVVAMIHACDVAAALVALCREGPTDALYELSDACVQGHRWREVVRVAGRALGREPAFVPIPDRLLEAAALASDAWAALTGSPALFGRGKAREILHRDWGSDSVLQPPAELWSPRITLREGMADTVAWWRGYCGLA